MVVALEGAPGAGKSTLAAEMGRAGALVVPEVNLLFLRPEGDGTEWYLERQVARWEMAALAARQGRTGVLDGDPFQPMWFNWAFAAEGWPDWRVAYRYFRAKVEAGRMGVPERYVFLRVEEGVRAERMLARELARGGDPARAARKVERYASLVEPQARYFGALGARFPGLVNGEGGRGVSGLEVLDFAAGWLEGA